MKKAIAEKKQYWIDAGNGLFFILTLPIAIPIMFIMSIVDIFGVVGRWTQKE